MNIMVSNTMTTKQLCGWWWWSEL